MFWLCIINFPQKFYNSNYTNIIKDNITISQWESVVFKELIRLANHLDSKGFVKEADYLDRIIKKAKPVPDPEDPSKGVFKYSPKDYDRYNKLGLITVDSEPVTRTIYHPVDPVWEPGFLAHVFLSFKHSEFDNIPGTDLEMQIIGQGFHETESDAKRIAVDSAKSGAPLIKDWHKNLLNATFYPPELYRD